MKVYRQIAAETRQKLCILTGLTPRLLDRISPNFTRRSRIIAIQSFKSGFTIVESVSRSCQCRMPERLRTAPKFNWLP